MKLVSVITPCFNEEENVRELYEQVRAVFDKLGRYRYEHIFIDNASTDKTVETLRQIAAGDRRVKVIVNQRNFGPVRSPHHAFLQATGDAVVSLSADLQDPPSLIPAFLERWEQGFKVVVGVKRTSRESWASGLRTSPERARSGMHALPRHEARSQRNRRAARRGRDGRGVPGKRPSPWSRGRGKGTAGRFLEGEERKRRFEREARISQPQSPGIAVIYSFQESPVPLPLPSSSSRHILVMELVEGETLSARLGRGALPLDETLDVAKQVAAALEAAHEKGIVHRDLKPGNVMLRPDGTVKVLDFGLAKPGAAEGAGSGADLSHSPTMTRGATEAGVILGTAAYMSPEQARGKPVDKRTDVWSFGVVVMECLTGRPLFRGETVSDLIAKILEREPDWNTLPRETPPRVRELLRRCLRKDARERLRDIGDARLELADVLTAPGGADAAAASAPRARMGVASRHARGAGAWTRRGPGAPRPGEEGGAASAFHDSRTPAQERNQTLAGRPESRLSGRPAARDPGPPALRVGGAPGNGGGDGSVLVPGRIADRLRAGREDLDRLPRRVEPLIAVPDSAGGRVQRRHLGTGRKDRLRGLPRRPLRGLRPGRRATARPRPRADGGGLPLARPAPRRRPGRPRRASKGRAHVLSLS